MGFFGEFIEELEEREERREYFERREGFFEDRSLLSEFFMPNDIWELEGSYYDPYSHGEMFYDSDYGHHGVLYGGMWHPLEYQSGNWIFVHPHRYRLPRNYRPGNLSAPQGSDFGGAYSQQPAGGQVVTGWMPGSTVSAQAQVTYAPPPAASEATYCTACGAVLAGRDQPCTYCGRSHVLR